MPLSQAARQELAAQVDSHVRASLAAAPAAAGAPAPAGFCDIWKEAKPVLTFLVSVIGLIPGAGTTASAALNALIALGNELCPGS
jgi:hypothetical protein